jgi:serine protease Do
MKSMAITVCSGMVEAGAEMNPIYNSGLASALAEQSGSLIGRVKDGLVAIQSSRFGAGAGVVWDVQGIILTNNHVLRRSTPQVTLADGRRFEARVLFREPEVDLAFLQIPADGLTALPIADSTRLRIGELVFAIGHPWGQHGYVTGGIISYLTTAHTSGKRGQVPVVRTDARLAPGNSGGPLVNASGELVGINTMIVGGDQGLAVASSVAVAIFAEEMVQAEAKSA